MEEELTKAFDMMKSKIEAAKGWRLWTRTTMGVVIGVIVCFGIPYGVVRLMSQSLYQRGPMETYLYNDVY